MFRLTTKKKLATILMIDLNTLKNKKHKNYIQYSTFTNKEGRLIYNPSKELKIIQGRLFKYLSRIETPDYLKSGKKGLSYLDNAKAHINNHNCIVTADISGFYKNCKRKHVYKMFIEKFEMGKDIAGIITDFVCYENFIPTGSSTSQLTAYFTYSKAFDFINQIANNKNFTFTLYVDDITFSSNNTINRSIIYEVNCRLLQQGLKLKTSKTNFYHKNEACIITGSAIDKFGNLRVLNKHRKSIIESYIEYRKFPENEKNKIKIKGKLQSARMIEKNIFPTFKI